jgi:hypothetical protein
MYHLKSASLVARTGICLAVLAAAPLLMAFRPFTPVQSVCPNCAEKGDKLHLPDGKVLVADIIAKNQDGYILSRFGELRFVQYPEVKKVEWAAGSEPRGLDGYDQILIKNAQQTLLHGKLVSVEPGKPMALNSIKSQLYTVMPDQVLVYYQRGSRKAPPRDAVAPTTAPVTPAPAAPAGK